MHDKEIGQANSYMLGFHCEEVNYQRLFTEQLDSITIQLISSHYDEEEQVLSIGINIILNFEQSKDNNFRFIAGYKIVDDNIMNEDFENLYLPIFVSSIFPYIRTFISSITSDSRGPIVLPTLDLRKLNLNEEIELKFNNS